MSSTGQSRGRVSLAMSDNDHVQYRSVQGSSVTSYVWQWPSPVLVSPGVECHWLCLAMTKSSTGQSRGSSVTSYVWQWPCPVLVSPGVECHWLCLAMTMSSTGQSRGRVSLAMSGIDHVQYRSVQGSSITSYVWQWPSPVLVSPGVKCHFNHLITAVWTNVCSISSKYLLWRPLSLSLVLHKLGSP